MKINLYKEILPENMREKFEITKIEKKIERKPQEEYWIYVEEKKDNYPKELKNISREEISLNGFLDRLEIIHSPINNNPVYLQIYRRRWKRKGETNSYHNEHEIHKPGMKCTQEFGNFLKELNRQKRSKFFANFSYIRNIKEKDF